MRRTVAAFVLTSIAVSPAAFAVDKEKAMYVGGTAAVAPKAEGVLATSDSDKLVFVAEKGGGVIEIPWKKIDEAEYGQKVGRRWKTAIFLSPAALFSKGRKHYLTISYKDKKDEMQSAVFELGKDLVRTTLTVVETRSGRKITYQDEEAAKSRAN
jgi:hypothetical protein